MWFRRGRGLGLWVLRLSFWGWVGLCGVLVWLGGFGDIIYAGLAEMRFLSSRSCFLGVPLKGGVLL